MNPDTDFPIDGFGPSNSFGKIQTIKGVRAVAGLMLKEAKDAVEARWDAALTDRENYLTIRAEYLNSTRLSANDLYALADAVSALNNLPETIKLTTVQLEVGGRVVGNATRVAGLFAFERTEDA